MNGYNGTGRSNMTAIAQTRDEVADGVWMRGSAAPLKGALLGLVLERPGHGYDLANRLNMRLGPAWRLEANRVYRLLDDLERSGLVRYEVQPSKHGPRQLRAVYHPTDHARGALTRWIETAVPREAARSVLQAKIAVAREDDAPRLLVALKRYESDCLELSQSLDPPTALSKSWRGLVIDCAKDAVDVQLKAEVDWARRTRQRIGEYVAGE
jgi:DNA-binding PadR family transcriptional regulator